MILYALSGLLLALTVAVVARRTPAEPGLRFWAVLAGVNLLLTLAHVAASVPRVLTPVGFVAVQGAILIVTAVVLRLTGAARLSDLRGFRPLRSALRWPGWRDPLCCVLTLCVAAALGLSVTEQLMRPVTGFDERMYNCSRVLYWIQHRHIWPWTTHNDAQIDFPIGSEVFFSWPILFTRTEWVGRLVYWFGFPCAVYGAYRLARTLGASRSGSAAAALVLAMTPAILLAAGVNQKQDIWTAAMLLGFTDLAVRARRDGGRVQTAMMCVYFILAVNIKITCLAVGPFLIWAALAPRVGRWRSAWRDLRWAVVAGGGAFLLSGLAVTMGQNLQRYGHPLGPPAAAKVVAPEWSARQVYTHAVRIPFQLIELPTYPGRVGEEFRRRLVNAGNEAIFRLDAHRALPGERRVGWPGWFQFYAGPPHDPRAYRFSAGGMVWLVGMTWALLAFGKCAVLLKRRRLPPSVFALLLSAVLLGSLAFLLRWVWGAPERYWIAPYAVGITAACASMSAWARNRLIAAVMLVALAATVYPSFESIAIRLRDLHRQPLPTRMTDEPFEEAVSKIPAGSTILFFGNRNARDYPLFLPRQKYANRVVPWGRVRFDPDRLESMIAEHGVTHALFEFEDRLGFHWYPGVRVAWMVEWFRTRPHFREVPLNTPRQRLFERIRPEPGAGPVAARGVAGIIAERPADNGPRMGNSP